MKVYVPQSEEVRVALVGRKIVDNKTHCIDLAKTLDDRTPNQLVEISDEVYIVFNEKELNEGIKQRIEETLYPTTSEIAMILLGDVVRVTRAYLKYGKALVIEKTADGNFIEYRVEDITDAEQIPCLSGDKDYHSIYRTLYKYIIEGIEALELAEIQDLALLFAAMNRFKTYGNKVFLFDAKKTVVAFDKVLQFAKITNIEAKLVLSEMMTLHDLYNSYLLQFAMKVIPPEEVVETFKKALSNIKGDKNDSNLMYL